VSETLEIFLSDIDSGLSLDGEQAPVRKRLKNGSSRAKLPVVKALKSGLWSLGRDVSDQVTDMTPAFLRNG
jgi:hypothetical protein